MHAEFLLERQICFRLYTASRLIQQAYTPMFSQLGITYPQYLVLMVLWEQDSLPVNNIAHRLMLETNTVTPLLQRMEKADLLQRRRDKGDKRRQIVSLSQKGRDLQERAFALIPQGMRERLSACPLKADDYLRLSQELDAIIDTLK